MTLNMAVKPGQEILAKLIAQCDVLVENFKVGTLEKWGFGNDWLEANAPRVIRCSITGYGSTGPESGPARLRLHPAGRVGAHEHLRRRRRASR